MSIFEFIACAAANVYDFFPGLLSVTAATFPVGESLFCVTSIGWRVSVRILLGKGSESFPRPCREDASLTAGDLSTILELGI